MSETPRGDVLVGVAAGATPTAAIELAVAEAHRRRSRVHLVHVVHLSGGWPDRAADLEVVRGELRTAGAEVLERAAAAAVRVQGDLDLVVRTELVHGAPRSVLCELSARAALVVVQRAHRSPLRHIPTMSTSAGVAARAHCPVAVVPEGSPLRDPSAPVVIGVKDPATSREVVRAGLELARLRSARVQLLHGWWFSDVYDQWALPESVATSLMDQQREALRREVDALLGADHPLEVEVLVRRQRPVDALVAASASAQAVVVGRHQPTRPWGWPLGATARTVLREAEGPVVVVDPSSAPA